jgi:hypothetical protein
MVEGRKGRLKVVIGVGSKCGQIEQESLTNKFSFLQQVDAKRHEIFISQLY